MRTLSAAVLLSLVSSFSHAGAFTGDVDISSTKGATTFTPDTRSIQAVSKFDYFFYASDFRSSVKDIAKNGIEGLAKTNTGSSWGGGKGDDCGGVPVPEPSTALLLLPGIAYLVLRKKKDVAAR